MDDTPEVPASLETLLLTAIEKTPDGYGIFDTDDRLLFCNSAFAKIFDHSAHQARGKSFSDLVRHVHRTRRGLNVEADDVEAWLKLANSKRRASHYRSFETDTCDGRWFLMTEQKIDNDYLFIFCTEVTEQKRTEAKLHKLTNELKVLAETDSLTGLNNRRHFLQKAHNELARSQRLRKSLALLVLDVDLFKQVNDRFGHQVGDQALQAIADAIRRVMRPYDVVGRIGGEEFAVLLPEAQCGEASRIAERLRQEVEAIDGDRIHPGLTMTISIGAACAEVAKRSTCLDVLMAKADRALYAAKHAGRNHVVKAECLKHRRTGTD